MGRQAAEALTNLVAAARVRDAFRPPPQLFTWSMIGADFNFTLSELSDRRSEARALFKSALRERCGQVPDTCG